MVGRSKLVLCLSVLLSAQVDGVRILHRRPGAKPGPTKEAPGQKVLLHMSTSAGEQALLRSHTSAGSKTLLHRSTLVVASGGEPGAAATASSSPTLLAQALATAEPADSAGHSSGLAKAMTHRKRAGAGAWAGVTLRLSEAFGRANTLLSRRTAGAVSFVGVFGLLVCCFAWPASRVRRSHGPGAQHSSQGTPPGKPPRPPACAWAQTAPSSACHSAQLGGNDEDGGEVQTRHSIEVLTTATDDSGWGPELEAEALDQVPSLKPLPPLAKRGARRGSLQAQGCTGQQPQIAESTQPSIGRLDPSQRGSTSSFMSIGGHSRDPGTLFNGAGEELQQKMLFRHTVHATSPKGSVPPAG